MDGILMGKYRYPGLDIPYMDFAGILMGYLWFIRQRWKGIEELIEELIEQLMEI